MRTLITLLLTLTISILHANDGAFYASGNHLIPIHESTVSVAKEILKIERIEEDYLKVTVNYTFYNPGGVKEILVGFEAFSPVGDVDGTPKNGRHPYMEDFKVFMNGHDLKHQVAMVNSKEYYKSGQIQSLSEKEAMGADFDVNVPDFYYVYYFTARFQPKTNTIKHTYTFKLSGSVDLTYNFNYILTAANRWANKQIDDFTLILDLGDFQDFQIDRTFFSGFENWSGASKLMDGSSLPYAEVKNDPLRVITQDQPVVFNKKNFAPAGELSLYCKRDFLSLQTESFDHNSFELPYNVDSFKNITTASDEVSFKILRNLPFARRGYVFKTAFIQDYFEKLDW